MKRSFHFLARKSHRYLGLIIGIQFLCWTIGGLYFSWSDMDEVHGDHQRKTTPQISVQTALVSPSVALQYLYESYSLDSVASLTLIQILGRPVYQIKCKPHKHHSARVYLVDAVTGTLRSPLSEEDAIQVAKEQFTESVSVVKSMYLKDTNGHHEYRGQPLPAYAITFDHPTHTTVYVATELGTVQKFRNDTWRMFDFLWMLHTMDYQGRDNISNWILRLFSILGLLTIFSGFALYWVSSRTIRRMRSV